MSGSRAKSIRAELVRLTRVDIGMPPQSGAIARARRGRFMSRHAEGVEIPAKSSSPGGEIVGVLGVPGKAEHAFYLRDECVRHVDGGTVVQH